jgi:hypothetical protein
MRAMVDETPETPKKWPLWKTLLVLTFVLAIPVLGFPLLAEGCNYIFLGSPESVAKEKFSRAYACPNDRVEVRPRNDLTYAKLHPAIASTAEPSPEIKSDPDRYARWKKERDAAQKKSIESHAKNDIIEVRGCGKSMLYSCGIGNVTINNSDSSDARYCNEEAYPSGTAW